MKCINSVLALLFFSVSLLAQSGINPLPPGMFSSEDLSPHSKLRAKNVIKQVPGQPPSITYGRSRQGGSTVAALDGNMPVDDGVEWQGRTAYLSLFLDPIVIDSKTKKTLWAHGGSAFWNTLTFVDTAKPGEKPHWVVALGSVEYPKYQQRYELETGKELELLGAPPAPAGVPFKPRSAFDGKDGKHEKETYQIVSTADEWIQLRDKLFGGRRPNLPEISEIDFKKESLLICYEGRSSFVIAVEVDFAVESDDRLLLRLCEVTSQSVSFAGKNNKAPVHYPYGLFVIPRRPGKQIVLEKNEQIYLGGPPMWKEFKRLGK